MLRHLLGRRAGGGLVRKEWREMSGPAGLGWKRAGAGRPAPPGGLRDGEETGWACGLSWAIARWRGHAGLERGERHAGPRGRGGGSGPAGKERGEEPAGLNWRRIGKEF